MVKPTLEELIEQELYNKTIYKIGDFNIDATLMLTDDIAHIMLQFKNNPDAIEDIIDHLIELPYMILLDIIHHLAKDKESFDLICATTTFGELLDSFSERVFGDKIDDEE